MRGGRIGGDREDQIVDLLLAPEVVRIGLVADGRIQLVVDEVERAGADRLGREVGHLVRRLASLSAYSFDTIEAKSMPRLASIGAFGSVSVSLTVRSSTFSILAMYFGMSMPRSSRR